MTSSQVKTLDPRCAQKSRFSDAIYYILHVEEPQTSHWLTQKACADTNGNRTGSERRSLNPPFLSRWRTGGCMVSERPRPPPCFPKRASERNRRVEARQVFTSIDQKLPHFSADNIKRRRLASASTRLVPRESSGPRNPPRAWSRTGSARAGQSEGWGARLRCSLATADRGVLTSAMPTMVHPSPSLFGVRDAGVAMTSPQRRRLDNDLEIKTKNDAKNAKGVCPGGIIFWPIPLHRKFRAPISLPLASGSGTHKHTGSGGYFDSAQQDHSQRSLGYRAW